MTVVIHNADGQVLGHTSLQHAIGMLARRVAEPYRWEAERNFGPYPLVTAVILVAAKYVYPKWLDRRAPFSRTALLCRDNGTCGYCGQPGDEVEHIVPKSQGGKLSWENCVLACRACNARKGNRTPEQAGMTLRVRPWVPTIRDIATW